MHIITMRVNLTNDIYSTFKVKQTTFVRIKKTNKISKDLFSNQYSKLSNPSSAFRGKKNKHRVQGRRHIELGLLVVNSLY